MRLALALMLVLSSCAPKPKELQAGVAVARIPAPIGMGNSGYSPFGAPFSPSPYAELWPATEHMNGHPQIRVMVISRGEHFEAVLVRVDQIGVVQEFREAVLDELDLRLGRDFDDILVMGATHTHVGPGRFMPRGGLFEFFTDRIHPVYFDRYVGAVADAIEEAYADLRPARLGTAHAQSSEAHNDRRCEDGVDEEDPRMSVLAVERDGVVDAVAFTYAIHGTVMSRDDLILSRDVSGAIEEQVEDSFDHPVTALFFNSWAGDMSPASPDRADEVGSPRDPRFDRMDAVGLVLAEALQDGMAEVTWEDEPTVHLETRRPPLDLKVLGYKDDAFPYPYGGLFCGANFDSDCDPATEQEGLIGSCLPLTDQDPAADRVPLTTGQIGGFGLLTFPGEPVTNIAHAIEDELKARTPVTDMFFIGYAQDHLGYGLMEADWMQGGYEPVVSMWGPKQGPYLVDRIIENMAWSTGAEKIPKDTVDMEPLSRPDTSGATPVDPSEPVTLGSILEDVPAQVAGDGLVTMVVSGSDPWLGTPLATVVTESGTAVTRTGGLPLDSDTTAFHIYLEEDPPYEDGLFLSPRTFAYRFVLALRRSVPGPLDLPAGRYTFVVDIPAEGGPTQVESAVFEVLP